MCNDNLVPMTMNKNLTLVIICMAFCNDLLINRLQDNTNIGDFAEINWTIVNG